MIKRLLLTLLALPMLAFCAGYKLVELGLPKAEIIIGDKPTRTAQFAAFELQHCVKLMTGATLPIIATASGKPDTTEILIGLDAEKYGFTGEEYSVSFRCVISMSLSLMWEALAAPL